MAADLEYIRAGYVNAGHIVAEEFQQLSSTEFTGSSSPDARQPAAVRSRRCR